MVLFAPPVKVLVIVILLSKVTTEPLGALLRFVANLASLYLLTVHSLEPVADGVNISYLYPLASSGFIFILPVDKFSEFAATEYTATALKITATVKIASKIFNLFFIHPPENIYCLIFYHIKVELSTISFLEN